MIPHSGSRHGTAPGFAEPRRLWLTISCEHDGLNVHLISMTRDLAIAGGFALLAGCLPSAFALAPKPGAPVAVIALPWAQDGDALRIVAAADGRVMGAAR